MLIELVEGGFYFFACHTVGFAFENGGTTLVGDGAEDHVDDVAGVRLDVGCVFNVGETVLIVAIGGFASVPVNIAAETGTWLVGYYSLASAKGQI